MSVWGLDFLALLALLVSVTWIFEMVIVGVQLEHGR